jgi:hypothetical protein
MEPFNAVAGFLISTSGSVVMYVFSVTTSVTGSGTTARSMLTTALDVIDLRLPSFGVWSWISGAFACRHLAG